MADDNNEDILKAKIMVDGVQLSLADLTGISLDDVAEKRGESFPKGVFQWEVDAENPPKIAVVGEGDKAKGAIKCAFKCIEVVTVSDSEFTGDENALVGKSHHETFFLTSEDSLGYVKAFFKDIGAPYSNSMATLLSGSAGTRFQAPIGKRKSKDDADVVYTNIVRNKIKPLASAAGSDVAAALAK